MLRYKNNYYQVANNKSIDIDVINDGSYKLKFTPMALDTGMRLQLKINVDDTFSVFSFSTPVAPSVEQQYVLEEYEKKGTKSIKSSQ